MEEELEIYRNALEVIAHWGFQSHGYAVEMQQIAERALKDGRELRTTRESTQGSV